MQWFKHDSNAFTDSKLRKVTIKYGMEGYGLYWYCLELIVGNVSSHNITFELEHDSEIIAHDTGIHPERVSEMMAYMVNIGLFEITNNNHISCLKIIKRLDSSMTSNPKMRAILAGSNQNSHDGVMIVSGQGHDTIMQDKNRKEDKRIEENSFHYSKPVSIPSGFHITPEVEKWAKEHNHKNLREHLDNFILTCESKGYKYKNWNSAFKRAVRDNWAGIKTAQINPDQVSTATDYGWEE